jgi:hypothetical protein
MNDADPTKKLIDRLLASPHYGERQGRLWFDVARYADTGGYETDVLFPNAWRYRDQVIRSFNGDKPYDVLIKEQVAADEVWPDNLDLNSIYELPESKRGNLDRRLGTRLYTSARRPSNTLSSAISTARNWRPSAPTLSATHSWDSPSSAPDATTTGSIPFRSAITIVWAHSSRAAKTAKCPSSAKCASSNTRAAKLRL